MPLVATNDGGPQDIIGTCNNGILVDALDSKAIGEAIRDALSDPERWTRWSNDGLAAAHANYSWDSHAARYVQEASKVVKGTRPFPCTGGGPSSRAWTGCSSPTSTTR